MCTDAATDRVCSMAALGSEGESRRGAQGRNRLPNRPRLGSWSSTPDERRAVTQNGIRTIRWPRSMLSRRQGRRGRPPSPRCRVRYDLRGWEWHYCQRLCELNAKNSAAAVPAPAAGARSSSANWSSRSMSLRGHFTNVAFSPDGTRVATTSGRRRGPLKSGTLDRGRGFKKRSCATWRPGR